MILVSDADKGPVSNFVAGYLVRDSGLMWAELEKLLIGKYTDEEIAVVVMRGLIRLTYARDKTPG